MAPKKPSPPPPPPVDDTLPDPEADILARANNNFQLAKALQQVESTYPIWLATLFPSSVYWELEEDALAPHHMEFWEHIWAIPAQRTKRPKPFFAIWPRGQGKSTSAELATIALGVRGICRFAIYISATQEDQANKHVGNIGTFLESEIFSLFYPEHSDRQIGKYGNVKSWNRSILRTMGGFSVAAFGLDTSFRGLKIDDQRPDLLVLDDVDQDDDSPRETERKIATITKKILPAMAPNAVVIGIQNLVTPSGFFTRLAGRSQEPADFFRSRIVSGPIPAIRDLEYETRDGLYVITRGTPTWKGQELEYLEYMMNDSMSAFRSEFMHDVERLAGDMYAHLDFEKMRITWDDYAKNIKPTIDRVAVWVDPAVTNNDRSDSHAIQVDSVSRDRKLYRLYSWEQRATPNESLTKALEKALEYGADSVGVETDHGGLLWKTEFRKARRDLAQRYRDADDDDTADIIMAIRFREARAGNDASKRHRSSRMLMDYEKDRIVHIDGASADLLERALIRFPRYKPFDLVDCAYHGWNDLMSHGKGYTSSPRNLRPSNNGGRPSPRSNVRRLPVRRTLVS